MSLMKIGEFQFGEKRSDLFDVEAGAFELFKFNVYGRAANLRSALRNLER